MNNLTEQDILLFLIYIQLVIFAYIYLPLNSLLVIYEEVRLKQMLTLDYYLYNKPFNYIYIHFTFRTTACTPYCIYIHFTFRTTACTPYYIYIHFTFRTTACTPYLLPLELRPVLYLHPLYL